MTRRLRDRLRAETREAHERVDAAFGRFTLGERAGYTAFLQATARALPAVEAAVEAAGAAALLPDWPERWRAAALLEDLQRLGAGRPAPWPAPALAGEGAVWGALYVLEGSRMGARLLLAEARGGRPGGGGGHDLSGARRGAAVLARVPGPAGGGDGRGGGGAGRRGGGVRSLRGGGQGAVRRVAGGVRPPRLAQASATSVRLVPVPRRAGVHDKRDR